MDIEKLNTGRKLLKKAPLNHVYGKVPPQAIELEQQVLGIILLRGEFFDAVREVVKAVHFYLEIHQKIFLAIASVSRKGQRPDIIAVVQELQLMEELETVGGAYAITKLTNSVTSDANVEAFSRIIFEKFMLREMIRISGDTIQGAYEDSADAFETLEGIEKAITDLSIGAVVKPYSTLEAEMAKRLVRIEELRKTGEHVTGVPTGFDSLDAVTHGWQPTDLVILAARPSVGKTALALNFARNAALHMKKKTKVGFFSLEMSAGQLTDRLMSSESGIHLDNIRNGNLDDQQMKTLYSHGIDRLLNGSIYIDDTAGLNTPQLRSKARRMVRKHGVKLIIIDYLQLMSGEDKKNGNREQEISKISRELKKLAKELEVPIIALSQLNRAVESRNDQTPKLSDLRESGAIEQDADMVIFLYRPAAEDMLAATGETHIKITKNRHGVLQTIILQAQLHIQKFIEIAEWNRAQPTPTAPLTTGNWRPVTESEKDDLTF